MKTIVVTGGGGFVGSNIVAALAQKGQYNVVVVDEFGDDEKWRNLRHHHVSEIVSPANLFYWLEMNGADVEAILNFGSIASTTERRVGLLLESNQSLPILLWRWCAENQARFIYSSSSAIYGQGEEGFDDTHDISYINTLRPLYPLGWSKLMFDRFAVTQSAQQKPTPPQWAGLRFFNVYGPNEYHKGDQRSVIHKIYPSALHDHAVKLYKSQHPGVADGQQKRDFVHVRDCVKVVLWLLDNPQVQGVYNVGTGQARSFDDMAKAIFHALGKVPQIKYVDMPSELEVMYQYFTEARLDKLRAAGYNLPFMSLEDGIKDYITNYLLKADPYL